MATYKVLQDIEAEDKLLGSLTLRQFIYAVIVVGLGFICFLLAKATPVLIVPLIPPMLLFSLLAAPIGKDQSSEVWLLAKIRFFLKPKKRIWDQSGLKELVTITVPKHVDKHLTNGLSQTEVRSRLQALANTIDSRGWAVKNVNVNLFAQPSYALNQVGSDRLLDPTTLGQEVPSYDTQGVVDMLDERSSTTAQKFDQLISTTQTARREQLMASMRQPVAPQPQAQPANYWFMNQTPQPSDPSQAAFEVPPVVTPGTNTSFVTPDTNYAQVTTEDEQALLEKLHHKQEEPDPMNSHLRTIEPLSGKKHKSEKPKAEKPAASPVTPATDPAILGFANRDDLNIATIARQVNKARPQSSDGEVVISLR